MLGISKIKRAIESYANAEGIRPSMMSASSLERLADALGVSRSLVYLVHIIYFFTVLIAFIVVPIPVFAGGASGSWNTDMCPDVGIDTSSIDTFVSELSNAFPFSLVMMSISLLDDLSNISPESPSQLRIPIVFVDIYPFSFLDEGYFDTVFQIIRIFMLAIIIGGIARFVLVRVL